MIQNGARRPLFGVFRVSFFRLLFRPRLASFWGHFGVQNGAPKRAKTRREPPRYPLGPPPGRPRTSQRHFQEPHGPPRTPKRRPQGTPRAICRGSWVFRSVLPSLAHSCGILRDPAASQKPRFPFYVRTGSLGIPCVFTWFPWVIPRLSVGVPWFSLGFPRAFNEFARLFYEFSMFF